MLMERSAGAVIFSIKYPRDVNFLLLKYSAGHWDFPKGNIENGEDETQAAYREIREETGIENVVFLKGFERKVTYNYRRKQNLVRKEVIFFLAKADSQRVILSNEHIAYSWNKFDNALAKLTYKTAKDILINANNFLKNKCIF
jgi:8-oxo-dGTP pyrophosphatase MutT (NUDIX family)